VNRKMLLPVVRAAPAAHAWSPAKRRAKQERPATSRSPKRHS